MYGIEIFLKTPWELNFWFLKTPWILMEFYRQNPAQTRAIHLRATRVKFASENIVIVAGIIDLKSYFRAKVNKTSLCTKI